MHLFWGRYDLPTLSPQHVDMNESRSRQAVSAVGWPSSLVSSTKFLTSGSDLISLPEVDVVVEATGNPAAGISHARQCIKNGKHVVMVNVEADVLAGPLLAREARDAGVVYSLAYGDQPALVAELIDWARSIGFQVVAAGKGTKYLPEYHWVTPDDVWAHYGLSPEDAKKGGMNPQMFNSWVFDFGGVVEFAKSKSLTTPTIQPTDSSTAPNLPSKWPRSQTLPS